MFKIDLKKRFGAFAAAAIVASCVAAPTAFAQTYYDDTLTNADINAIPSVAATADSRPTAAATRAAMPAAEILGLQGVEESGQLIFLQSIMAEDEDTGEEYVDYYQPIYSWYAPKYLLFTTSYSSQPSPYLVNFAVHSGNMAVYNPNRGGTSGNGPNQVLAGYGTGDADDDAVWDMRPDVIIGTGGLSDSALAALADPDAVNDGYAPAGVNYNVSHYPQLIQTVADIRDAAGNASVTANANAYIAFINNAADTAEEGTIVAWVKGYTAADAEAGTAASFTIGSSYASNGTAATNRYLETCEWAGAENLNTNTTSADMEVSAATLDTADIIVVGGQQQSSGDFDTIMGGLYDAHTSEIDLLAKTYFVNGNDMRVGSAYGVVMNSIENAQNIARILQPITGLDQYDALAYYYQNFYHINSTDVDHVLSMALDGYVRNWDVAPDYSLTPAQNIEAMTAW